MSDVTKQQNDDKLSQENKVASLFQYIRELNKLKQNTILNIREYPWYFKLSDLPNDAENIIINYPDRVEGESTNDESVIDEAILSVSKPEFEECPTPDAVFADWLNEGWRDFDKPVKLKKYRPTKNGKVISPDNRYQIYNSQQATLELKDEIEYFTDKNERVTAFRNWKKFRDAWVEKEEIAHKTYKLFTDLYSLYVELQRDSETKELIAANGFLCDNENPEIEHPLLTHRVKLSFNADENTIKIMDTDHPSELYSDLFQKMKDINFNGIKEMRDDLQKNDYHPLDRNATPGFLKVLVHQLSSDSIYSSNGIPESWKISNRFLLYTEPCFILRKRLDGTLKAIEQIIENVKDTGEIPQPIKDIVSGGNINVPEDTGEEPIEERLAAVGGESVDILLSKEANKEQLEIAKRIEYYNAVLVQGPPGTGKTHTIANLMGHFLAQGKSVLVTSQTVKALSVLKEKTVPGLQNLCVSMLDDSNVDMERSVEGITRYMSKTTSSEVKREIDVIAVERREIITKLASIRKKIFKIINQECNCILYNGEEISPSKAAKFVFNHKKDLSYIPGKVRLDTSIPLTFDELTQLYRSNEQVSLQVEEELSSDLPNPDQIMSPVDYSTICKLLQFARKQRDTLKKESGLDVTKSTENKEIVFDGEFNSFKVSFPNQENIKALKEYVSSFHGIEDWMKAAATDGKNEGAYRSRWVTLIEQIKKVCNNAESFVSEKFGKKIHYTEQVDIHHLKETYEALKNVFATKKKIGKITLMLHKEYETALDAVEINGEHPQSCEDCELILHSIEFDEARNQCAVYWDELLSLHGVPKFFDLDKNNPERIAANWVVDIKRYLEWYNKEYQTLLSLLSAVGIPANMIFNINSLDSDLKATEKILVSVDKVVPQLCDILTLVIDIQKYVEKINDTKAVLLEGKRGSSITCETIIKAIDDADTFAYSEAFAQLQKMYSKYSFQRNRGEMLKALSAVAPEWADAIREHKGIHGSFTVPNNIEDAWKWKQLSGIIDDLTAQPLSQLQAESIRLSKEYREATAQYAEKSAWYHLLKRTESNIDLKQALQGWKQTVKRIGKGTGKQAPLLKAKARELMPKCQDAVPGWIMTINRALESLNPRKNSFDIIIIDEASQSDISSLAILYMGKKLIIVGDDKQVSPMAIGDDIDKMTSLQQMYIKDKIPNFHLYSSKTSIYDIASTTFQPLMLREHFRCVPEIIGFSNMLSYDNKIKPLRDASSSNLLPAVVNYRVADGHRLAGTKENPKEAETIVALLKACIEQPEYAGKTFGIISLLGNDQVALIDGLINKEIDRKEIAQRRILCGNSANFQGDERDVVFLSVVDSGNGNGPLHLQGYGPDDAYRKRYNVAASRAKDQLWVVDSLDSSVDLKPGDIRKTLIDYSLNPAAFEITHAQIEKQSESPFEKEVATALSDRGYHLVQQWKVGAYRLDIVAIFGKKTVAIECDGERWHSGEAKIREDMERQTVLERLGWRFIRIRGSEYYSNSEKTIERVINELKQYGIEPESATIVASEDRNTELLNRVKNRAQLFLVKIKESEGPEEPDEATIAAALNPKIMISDKDLKDIGFAKQETKVLSKTTAFTEIEPEHLDNKKNSKSNPDQIEKHLKRSLPKEDADKSPQQLSFDAIFSK